MTKRIISGCVAVLALVFTAKIILSLISETTLALLTGTLTGIMIAVPCAILITILAMRQGTQAAPPPAQPQQPQFPPPESDEWRAIYWELRCKNLEQQRESRVQLPQNAPVDAAWRYR
jgi:hypothetical protein